MNIGNRNNERSAQHYSYLMIVPGEAVNAVLESKSVKKSKGIYHIKQVPFIADKTVFEISGSNKEAVMKIVKEISTLVAGKRNLQVEGDSLVYSILVPSEAMNLVRNKSQQFKTMPGIVSINAKSVGLNRVVCYICGSRDAVNEVAMKIEKCLVLSRKRLSNDSRKIHSYIPTRGGRVLTPDQVHPGVKKAKKYSKKWEYQQDRIRTVQNAMKRKA
ncbi:hypothetical protein HK103_005090 [Boothiomyces macroporosus]|uniref:Uncharacterized protein n=1 Tax=Boothiomyces macroporosus TaxID=261099 RepID=A0AAD5UFS1_9FUNG|nr:hypothetical protein HK103_005090 [Boothiomyces macroporosus]